MTAVSRYIRMGFRMRVVRSISSTAAIGCWRVVTLLIYLHSFEIGENRIEVDGSECAQKTKLFIELKYLAIFRRYLD